MDATDQALQELFAEQWVAIGFSVVGGKSGQQIVDCFGGVGYGVGEQAVAERIVTEHNAHEHLMAVLVASEALEQSIEYSSGEVEDIPRYLQHPYYDLDGKALEAFRQAIERVRAQVGGAKE